MNSTVQTTEVSPGDILVLSPVFNDWVAFGTLLDHLDASLAEAGMSARVLAVDDGSITGPDPETLKGRSFRSIAGVEVLELRRNLGHQRAIGIGLAYVEDKDACELVVVMDCDGEDDPRDVPRLIERCRAEGNRKIVFAERAKRSESLAFRFGYAAYKAVHYLLTGVKVRVGNFSVVPRSRLTSLVVVSEMWNHYAAAVFKSRQPYCTIPTHRATRYHGRSSMNYVSLIAHGLSAISVFSDLVGVRLLILTLPMILLTALGLAFTVYLRLMTPLAIPGWATTAFGVLAILLFQSVMLALIFSFMVLGGRSGSNFLLRREYPYYVLKKVSLWP